jgi:uncharacterized protein
MGFIRILIIIIVIFLLWQLYFRIKRQGEKARPQLKQQPSIPMLRCQHCGTHIPENEAIKSPKGVYCCEQHRREAEFN